MTGGRFFCHACGDKRTVPLSPFSIDDIIEKNPYKGEKYKCVEFADALAEELTKNREPFERVNLQYPVRPGVVYSKLHNDLLISLNGYHTGILYNGTVYCNVHIYGLPEIAWKEDFRDLTGEEPLYYYGPRR